MDLNAPYFLCAMPKMDDEQFRTSVVLVAAHDEDGAFGLILNMPVVDEEAKQAQMTAEVKDMTGAILLSVTEDLFLGGPVEAEAIFALHDMPALGTEDSRIEDDLYLETDPEVFQKILGADGQSEKRRFFLGCSQWEAGQLESEIRQGAWMPLPCDRRVLFEERPATEAESVEVWKQVLRRGGVDPLTLMGQGGSDSGPN